MEKKLLIVESPAKAKTIAKYLGSEFVVKSSVGHIRDLPKETGSLRIAPDGENRWTFTPTYEIPEGKRKVVAELKAAAKEASAIYLASDPDREGEAIAWHLREVLGPSARGKPFYRVTYNEITRPAVLKAVANPRDIDMPLVDAQQARRILDRIVGYKVSPLLWRNVACANSRTLSAGRVQSVALRLLVERQREIDAFKSEKYFQLGVEVKKTDGSPSFVARLARMDGEKPEFKDKQAADNALLDLAGATLSVTTLRSQGKVRHALPPFTTSTLQQAASSVLGFSPGKTMKLAQTLYEQGRITYMRTDSVAVSGQARDAAQALITERYGRDYYPLQCNVYRSKADAQGAHEAIRPTDVTVDPTAAPLEDAAAKLYDLVWRRFVASQMADARTTLKTAALEARKGALGHRYEFSASATEVDFEGFLKVMKMSLKKKKANGEDDEDSDEIAKLPPLTVGEVREAARWIEDEKQTKGPQHYSEASLIKALEENGVGRPSTYAATIETLKEREYASSEKKNLVPLERGFLVNDWLVGNMERLFNVGFTAEMESELDKVAERGESMDAMLSTFYGTFQAALPPPPKAPDREKFKVLFALLDHVTEWTPSKTVGNRVYDDRAFVESVRAQAKEGARELTERQLNSLVRMVRAYARQIPEADDKLRELGLAGSASALQEKADAELCRFCFAQADRLDGMMKNPFLKSLREQLDRGRDLSLKQFAILARELGERAVSLPDGEALRARLAPYVPGGFRPAEDNPMAAALLEMAGDVVTWRPVVRRGKRVYDDRSFADSLREQYSQRRVLSDRQVAALRRMVIVYHDQIPNYEARLAAADALGNGRIQVGAPKPGEDGEGVDGLSRA